MRLTRNTLTEANLLSHSSHGVITAELLERLGIPQRTTYRRCQPTRQWTHLLPGIVLLSRATPSARQRVEAARMHTDMRGIVTGLEAARRYGLKIASRDTSVHMLVPSDHKFCSAKFVVVERTKYFPEPNLVDGIPLAPPARAVLDAVRRIRELSPVSALLLETLESGLCSYNELATELESGSRRGTALPRAVLRQLSEDIRSVPELEAKTVWKAAGLPAPLHNAKIFDAQKQFIAMPDLWCDEVALAWEIDSWTFHEKRLHYAKTLARNSRYAGHGIVVVQTLPGRLRQEPDAVIAELRAAYAAAQARPRPDIITIPGQRSAA